MPDPVPAEEKLLKLIRTKNQAESAKAAKQTGNKTATLGSSLQNKGAGFLTGSILAAINRVLLAACVLVLVFVAVLYLFSNNVSTDRMDVAVNQKILTEKDSEIYSENIRDYSFYEKEINSRKIFESLWEKPKSQEGLIQNLPAVSNLSSEIRVIGVMLDDAPKATLEQVKTKETFVVSVGEKVGRAVIKGIFEDKVLMQLDGETIELGY